MTISSFGICALIVPYFALTIRRFQDAGLSFNCAWFVFGLTKLISFLGANNGIQVFGSILVLLMLALTLLPSDALVGKFGKLTRDK